MAECRCEQLVQMDKLQSQALSSATDRKISAGVYMTQVSKAFGRLKVTHSTRHTVYL